MARYPHPLWSSKKASWRRELGVERPSGESPEKEENVAAPDYWAIKFKECVGRRRGRPSTVGLQEPSGALALDKVGSSAPDSCLQHRVRRHT